MDSTHATTSKVMGALAVGLLGIVVSVTPLTARDRGDDFIHSPEREGLYLPTEDAIKFLSFGFQNVGAHLMWFKTINYFGKHYSTDRDLRWLGHMCSLAIKLNVRAREPYQFCANMLSWEANDPRSAVTILDKAVEQFPEDWFFLYLRGFNKLYFLHNPVGAKDDLIMSARKPEAPSLVGRLAAKQLAEVDDLDSAIDFLNGMIATERDPKAREALIGKLKDALLTRDLSRLEKAVALYKEKSGHSPSSLDDLVTAGIVSSIVQDPYGGSYSLDSKGAKVVSSSRQGKRIKGVR